MVLDYYSLREQPFGVTPDARYLYASATHREALASILYGLQAERGFVALIAEPGMGKTTLLHSALHQIQGRARTAFLFQTIPTPEDFLRTLLRDLGIQAAPGSLVELQEKLNGILVEQSRSGKPLVIVVDEAQNLDRPVLELLRMLSNFETSHAKLLQIILSGQPQLAEKLASPDLVQLRQRISIVARLKPFSPEETALYIDHRLQTAGYSLNKPLFNSDALALIAEHSKGIPRNINNLCFNAVSLGCALKKTSIDGGTVREVIGDLDLTPLSAKVRSTKPPDDASPRMAPSLSAPAVQRRSRDRWRYAFAFAAAILLILCATLLMSGRLGNRWASSALSIEAAGMAPSIDPVTMASAQNGQNSTLAASSALTRISTIQVAPGQTLFRICINSFARCDEEMLQEIRTLNPKLSSLSHFEAGRTNHIRQRLQIAWRRARASLLPEKRMP